MRILVSNPDTIGDVVLRQPLLARLARDGHELAVVVRPLVEPLIDLIAPEAAVIRCDAPPYEAGLEPSDPRLDIMAKAAQSFDPEIVVAAPWQQTPVEARLLDDLAGARRIGFVGRRFFDPAVSAPPTWSTPLDTAIETPVETPELRKNELLARAALGRAVRLGDPRLTLSDEHKALATAAIEKLGLKPGAYIVACVGHSKWTRIRNWRLDSWAEALAHWKTEHHRQCLLIGAADERETSRQVRELMGDAGLDCAEWFGDSKGDVTTLVGLIGLSRGYLGRDTGPMHLAAALNRPVVAVFGGGTWPRFTPAVTPSVTVTISVPCAGCEWRCDLEDSHCIKEVPVAEVIAAIDQLESGSAKKRTTRALTPPPALAARISAELTRAARQRLVEISVERHGKNAEEPSVTATATKELDAARAAAEQERRKRLELEADLKGLRESANQELRKRVELEAELKILREQRGVDQERAGYLDGRLEKRTEDLLRAREERAELKAKLQVADELAASRIGSLERQLDGQRQQIQGLSAKAESARADAEQLHARLEAEQRRADSLAKSEAALQERLGQLQGRIKQLEPQQPGTIRDMELKIRRAQSDMEAAMRLSRQREHEIVVAQSRLNDLLASRWRKLGQRLGVAMTLPWETETNGRA